MWSFFSKDPTKELVNFEIQEPVPLEPELQEKTIWSLNNAKRKGGPAAPNIPGAPQAVEPLSTVFSYQMKPGNESWINAAKNGLKRMKMLRHPNILMFQDGLETDKSVFIVSERVQTLYSYLNESKENASQKENEIAWGLHQIATALSFLNNDCKVVHNNVCMSSVVVNKAGEWKLCGFEYAHAADDANPYKVLPALDRYEPPERSVVNNLKSGGGGARNQPGDAVAVDGWMLGCLVWEIYNGVMPNAQALKNPGRIPKRLVSVFTELMQGQTGRRLVPARFVGVCSQPGGFLDNQFVETLLFLEQIQIKDQNEKTKFFSELTEKLDDFPKQLCLFKILPQLLNAYEFGNAGSSVLAPLFKLGKLLDEAEYQKKIIPVVVKLFSSTERTTRMRLLQQLHLFVEHLSATIINDQLFPNICQGFADSNPAIREGTIRAIVLIASKLNYNNLNVELMKHLARLQAQDDQGMIRTNTTVCIGKIAPYINPQLRQRILLSAFPKAMRDPFPLARLSGIVALANTDRFYTLKDIAGKVLPSLSMACVDPEKDIRDEAFKTIKSFLQKLEKVSEQPELALEMEKDISSCTLDVKNETSWTSWAVTSLSAKMSGYKNKNQQPSVALNTQPLGPPPSMMPAASNSSPDKPTQQTSPKSAVEASGSKPAKSAGFEPAAASPFGGATQAAKSSNAGGWEMDDSEWKDLDDDGDMEPLEPVAPSKPAASSFAHSSSGNSLAKPKPPAGNGDWSNWVNSFDDEGTNKPATNNFDYNSDDSFSSFGSGKPSAGAKPSGAARPQQQQQQKESSLPPASSYNWSTAQGNSSSTLSSQAKNEEDLFSSLVKDISIGGSKPAAKPASSDWSSDWNDVFEDANKPGRDAKRQERAQRNNEKQQENATKQSKPLKLGQKKNEPPLF